MEIDPILIVNQIFSQEFLDSIVSGLGEDHVEKRRRRSSKRPNYWDSPWGKLLQDPNLRLADMLHEF